MKKEKVGDKTKKHQGAMIQTDPFGSYTGRTETIWDLPVQDVDDL